MPLSSQSAAERRPYRSERRRSQARATRAAILDAARTVFAAQGYASGSREAIAREAGVAVQTIGATFGTKRALLEALVAEAERGDGRAPSPATRSWPQELREQPDGESLLRRHAAGSRAVSERMAQVTEVVRRAAAADAEIAVLWESLQQQRLRGQATVVELLATRSPLRAGLSRAEAADILWALTDDGLYQAMVAERGWRPERFEAWLSDTMGALLLG